MDTTLQDQLSTVITLAQQLLACPSITPDDAGCQIIIRKHLERAGFHCESLRFDEVDNLWARYGTASPLFVFAGHTDVVPTGPESQWSTPPFQPVIRDDVLYARGATDMKGALAAMLIAAEEFVKSTPRFHGSIGFLITSDEEGAARNGTAKVIHVLQERGEKIDYCMIGEPSSDKQLGDQIRVGRRGSLHCKLIVHGKQGHVAHPHLAVNPIHLSAPALHELATTEWDKGNEYYPPTTFQISNIHGGTGAANVIPGDVEILCNFRFSTAVTVGELQKRTEDILKKHGLTFDAKWEIGGEPFLTKKGKLISATEQAIQETLGISAKLSTGGGTSDGRFIAPTGAEVVELGVPNKTAHHINECVKVEDLMLLAKIYYAVLGKVFNSI
jgi:succinyl-diaminopimelate desuccinylase